MKIKPQGYHVHKLQKIGYYVKNSKHEEYHMKFLKYQTRITFTRTLIANKPNTAPEAPTETEFLGRTNQETRFAPAPVRI